MRERIIYRLGRESLLTLLNFQNLEVQGKENFPNSGPLIVVFNHPSSTVRYPFLGLAAAISTSPWKIKEVILLTISNYRQPSKTFMNFLNKFGVKMIPIKKQGIENKQGNPITKGLVEAKKALNKGKIVIISPEGKGNKRGELGKAQKGAAWLAIKTGVPILPIGIGCDLERKSSEIIIPRRLWIGVNIGTSFTLKVDSKDELQSATDEIMQRITALLPSEMHGVYAKI